MPDNLSTDLADVKQPELPSGFEILPPEPEIERTPRGRARDVRAQAWHDLFNLCKQVPGQWCQIKEWPIFDKANWTSQRLRSNVDTLVPDGIWELRARNLYEQIGEDKDFVKSSLQVRFIRPAISPYVRPANKGRKVDMPPEPPAPASDTAPPSPEGEKVAPSTQSATNSRASGSGKLLPGYYRVPEDGVLFPGLSTQTERIERQLRESQTQESQSVTGVTGWLKQYNWQEDAPEIDREGEQN